MPRKYISWLENQQSLLRAILKGAMLERFPELQICLFLHKPSSAQEPAFNGERSPKQREM